MRQADVVGGDMLFFRSELARRGLLDPARFQEVYRAEARRLGSRDADPAIKTVEGWIYTGRKPQRAFRPVITSMLGYDIDDLWADDTERPPPTVRLAGTSPEAPHADPGMDLGEMRRSGAMAVRRARSYILKADSERAGEDTLPLLHDQVARLVRDYPRVPLSVIWDDLLDAQDQIIAVLETRRHRPSQLKDLNFLAGVLSFLVAKGLNDMEDRDAARTMSMLALAFAKDAEHQPLIASVNGLQSLIEYWADRPSDALFYAEKGAESAQNLHGTVGLWLLGLQARAAAVLGDNVTAQAAGQAATDLRQSVVADDLDQLGGLFTYSQRKQEYYHVEAAALLGQGSVDLAAQAAQAVDGFADRDSEDWAFGDLAGAQCNQALVHLHTGDIDGAAEAIRPVLDLAPGYRNIGIIVSAQRVRAALTTGPTRTARVAGQLRDEIASFPPRRLALPATTRG
ncbi:hypothetical protein [Streptomyces sp. NRRL F-5126]|uniref:hypothetical protein n=1 Tax=Streptomyces sp. NRRL F-5126 TaxID=1463857 RepID=UPI000AD7C377|nr:hypothetical protein [Streptomyces sp. NRRL F-5126]